MSNKLVYGEALRVPLYDQESGISGWVFLQRSQIVSVSFSIPHKVATIETTGSLLTGNSDFKWVPKSEVKNGQIVSKPGYSHEKIFRLSGEPVSLTLHDEQLILELWNLMHGGNETLESCPLFVEHNALLEKIEKAKKEEEEKQRLAKSGIVDQEGNPITDKSQVGGLYVPTDDAPPQAGPIITE